MPPTWIADEALDKVLSRAYSCGERRDVMGFRLLAMTANKIMRRNVALGVRMGQVPEEAHDV